jgi:nucleoside-diphosphate-sugar epimerase
MVQRVCVTGASGKAGRAVVADLREHGYDVLPTDAVVSREDRDEGMLRADLTDYGQAVEALSQAGVDAVVHLANIPAPGLSTPAVTFNSNITMNFNVFQAAAALKLNRVVWASSETTLGLPFDTPPRYAPVDEDHYPVPTSTYALSKVASETVAGHIAQWSGLPFIALRFSNIMAPEDYQWFAEFQDDPHARKWNLWGYIDARDGAQAIRRALEAEITGAERFIIANADTVMSRANEELVAEVFPGVEFRSDGLAPNDTLLAIDKARRVLGYEPSHSWRDEV